MNTLLLKALRCENRERPPVWFMRQAGRYMPEYRLIRKQHSLWDLFHTPSLAAKITLLPIDLLNVDAAILFSDILVIAEVFGLEVRFPEGQSPFIYPKIESLEQIDRLPYLSVEKTLSYVTESIELILPQLAGPLIGFCGGPFTVASYFIGHDEIGTWLLQKQEALDRLIDKVTQASIEYLKLQMRAGVKVIQIFDSWADKLNPDQFRIYSKKYLKKMIDAVLSFDIPVIIFCRGSSLIAKELSQLAPTAISFDWKKELKDLRKEIPSHIAIQGNLNPQLLLGSKEELLNAARKLLRSMQGDPGFIFNLGHGVLPNTPFENVKALTQLVQKEFTI